MRIIICFEFCLYFFLVFLLIHYSLFILTVNSNSNFLSFFFTFITKNIFFCWIFYFIFFRFFHFLFCRGGVVVVVVWRFNFISFLFYFLLHLIFFALFCYNIFWKRDNVQSTWIWFFLSFFVVVRICGLFLNWKKEKKFDWYLSRLALKIINFNFKKCHDHVVDSFFFCLL